MTYHFDILNNLERRFKTSQGLEKELLTEILGDLYKEINNNYYLSKNILL